MPNSQPSSTAWARPATCRFPRPMIQLACAYPSTPGQTACGAAQASRKVRSAEAAGPGPGLPRCPQPSLLTRAARWPISSRTGQANGTCGAGHAGERCQSKQPAERHRGRISRPKPRRWPLSTAASSHAPASRRAWPTSRRRQPILKICAVYPAGGLTLFPWHSVVPSVGTQVLPRGTCEKLG